MFASTDQEVTHVAYIDVLKFLNHFPLNSFKRKIYHNSHHIVIYLSRFVLELKHCAFYNNACLKNFDISGLSEAFQGFVRTLREDLSMPWKVSGIKKCS